MKSKPVATVASDEENVRLRIYDGDIPLGEAGGDLLKLALAEHHRNTALVRCIERQGREIERIVRRLAEPWPVRWWRAWKGRNQ